VIVEGVDDLLEDGVVHASDVNPEDLDAEGRMQRAQGA
jgi:hypothetical protein